MLDVGCWMLRPNDCAHIEYSMETEGAKYFMMKYTDEKTEIDVTFPFEDGGSVSGIITVTSLGNNLYRLEENPFAEQASFRDVIEVENQDAGKFLFSRVAQKSDYKTYDRILPKALVESALFEGFLKRVEKENGNWEIVFGGIIFINLPHDSQLNPEREVEQMQKKLD